MSKPIQFEGARCFRQRLVLSILSGRPVKISKIRHEDDNPGLKDYEISFLRLLDKLSNGTVVEINHSGTAVLFRPGMLSVKRKLEHDCGTSRSIGYFLEPVMMIAPFAKLPLHLVLTGITNDDLDPSVDILRTTTLPLLKRCGLEDNLELKIAKRGAPPLGGGEVVFRCPNVKQMPPVDWTDMGKIKRIRGIVYSTRMSPQTANRVVESARGLLNHFIPDVYIYTDHYKGEESGKSPGYAVSLVAETTAGCLYSAEACAGAGTNPEDLGALAAKLLFEEISRGGCVDTQNQSLALLFMVLGAEDVSKIRLGKLSPFTIQFLRHLKEFFGVTFKIKADPDTGTVMLTCVGVGFMNFSRKVI